MSINVFGNASNNADIKIDTSFFVQRPYLRTNYIEANIEEDIDLKGRYRIHNLPDPISIRETCSKNYVDNLFNDPSIKKNTTHIDLNDRKNTNARFIQVNQLPQIDSHPTAKFIQTENVSIFDNLDLRKYYIEIDVQRYPRDSSLMNYEQNDYIEQYRDLNLFFREYIGEPLMSPFISYLDMKTKYPIEVIDLRHQPDHKTPKKTQLFLEYNADPENARFSLILIRRAEIELISDGNKLIEVKII